MWGAAYYLYMPEKSADILTKLTLLGLAAVVLYCLTVVLVYPFIGYSQR